MGLYIMFTAVLDYSMGEHWTWKNDGAVHAFSVFA
jgi:hypothetical protein